MEYKKEDFPKNAIYRKPANRIPFVTDFEDGEEVEFLSFLDRPNAWKDGYVKYKSKYGEPKCNLINIRDLEDRMHDL